MKNLPNIFPIRYALFIDDFQSKKKGNYLQEQFAKALWSKLITLLQNKPLSTDMLSLRFESIGYSYEDIELCRIPELNPQQKDWAKQRSEELQKLIPEGIFSNGWGSAFELGLYSYAGMVEVPMFWQVYQHKDQRDYVGKKLGLYGLNYINFIGLAETAYKMYQDIQAGNVEKIEKIRALNKSSAFYLKLPYSKLWACLDRLQNNGIIPVRASEADIDESELGEKWYKGQPEKINVLVVKDINSLFMAEMLALYEQANFCNSCDRMLPFKYTGTYCQDNKDCKRKRDSQRAKRSRSQKRT